MCCFFWILCNECLLFPMLSFCSHRREEQGKPSIPSVNPTSHTRVPSSPSGQSPKNSDHHKSKSETTLYPDRNIPDSSQAPGDQGPVSGSPSYTRSYPNLGSPTHHLPDESKSRNYENSNHPRWGPRTRTCTTVDVTTFLCVLTPLSFSFLLFVCF